MAFDFTQIVPRFFKTLNLKETTILQSFAIDEVNGHIYAAQVTAGSTTTPQDFTISRLSLLDGSFIDYMKVSQGGHPTNIAVETSDLGIYIWYGDNDGPLRTLTSIKYIPNTTQSSTSIYAKKYTQFLPGDNLCPTIDNKNRKLAIRRDNGTTDTVYIYDLDSVKANGNTVLNTVTIPYELNYLQGFSLDGDVLYWYAGDTNEENYPLLITSYDVITGAQLYQERATVGFGLDNDFTEPEGVFLYTHPTTGDRTLFLGISTGDVGARVSKFYSFPENDDSYVISFGGFAISDYMKIVNVKRDILPPREINLLDVPGRNGAYFSNARYGVRQIDVDVIITARTPSEYMATMRFLAFAMDINEPTEMVFSDEPGKYYYGILADKSSVDQVLNIGKGTLTFLCPDPFAYSIFPKTLTPANNLFTFVNKGTTTTYPKFTVDFTQDATFASFISPDGVVLIGNPNEPDQIVLPKTQYKLNDGMASLSGWASSTLVDAGRTVAGTVAVSGDGIIANSYGSGAGWHGPAIRKDLPETVKDFTVKVRMDFESQDGTSKLDGDQLGRLEIYLYDASGFKIGKMIMRDSYNHYEFNIPEIFIQNTTFLEDEPRAPGPTVIPWYEKDEKGKWHWTTKEIWPSHVGSWNDFYGEFTLQRVGSTWYAEVSTMQGGAKDPQKKIKPIIKKTFTDNDGKFTNAELSYIVINYLQYGTNPAVKTMRVDDVKVLKWNTDTTIDVPAIFSAGDQLVVDFNDNSVRVNGNLDLSDVDVASRFFSIPDGMTQVKFNSDDPNATVTAEFIERYL
ncbi:distal tail protein Dit [Neobacillus sp. M.A.Huq-85]